MGWVSRSISWSYRWPSAPSCSLTMLCSSGPTVFKSIWRRNSSHWNNTLSMSAGAQTYSSHSRAYLHLWSPWPWCSSYSMLAYGRVTVKTRASCRIISRLRSRLGTRKLMMTSTSSVDCRPCLHTTRWVSHRTLTQASTTSHRATIVTWVSRILITMLISQGAHVMKISKA